MLERHCNISRHAHTVATEYTATVQQTGDVLGWRAGERVQTRPQKEVRRCEVSHKLFWCSPVNSFTANYTGVKCVLLQFTSVVSDFPEGLSPDSPANWAVQCNSGLYKPECATVCKLLSSCACICALYTAERHIFLRSISGTLLGPIRKRTQTNHMIRFYIEPYDILSQSLKIALIPCVRFYEDWFNSHVKYLSSLRPSPWPISIVPLMLCASSLCNCV